MAQDNRWRDAPTFVDALRIAYDLSTRFHTTAVVVATGVVDMKDDPTAWVERTGYVAMTIGCWDEQSQDRQPVGGTSRVGHDPLETGWEDPVGRAVVCATVDAAQRTAPYQAVWAIGRIARAPRD